MYGEMESGTNPFISSGKLLMPDGQDLLHFPETVTIFPFFCNAKDSLIAFVCRFPYILSVDQEPSD